MIKVGDTVTYCNRISTGVGAIVDKVPGVVTKIDGDLIHVKVDDLPPITVIVHRNNIPGVSQDWIEA